MPDLAPAQPEAIDDDNALAQRVARGDRLAFEQLMRRFNRRLYRLARATLRDDAEAEDALQDAYLAAYRAIGGFRGESSLSTWLSRLVLNACLARLRKQARRDNIVPMVRTADASELDEHAMSPTHTAQPPELIARSQLRALMERRLDELPQAFRTVFILRGVEELSVEETARVLGIPEATVRSRHFRARGLLREALARDVDLAERDVFAFDGARCDRIVANVLDRLAAADG
jgi:RNA polymerase sigma-70 factor (ECF subfamily)